MFICNNFIKKIQPVMEVKKTKWFDFSPKTCRSAIATPLDCSVGWKLLLLHHAMMNEISSSIRATSSTTPNRPPLVVRSSNHSSTKVHLYLVGRKLWKEVEKSPSGEV
ncbi:unnamed protein product [Lactuca virosa]|uniref:Uncharacterized protein n=1 Tax=Lactuca virosa TaxID=75947 RepID=A0AAU9MTZ4_9ASTR|nr:unnamed protein product [Lactuca virosa]